MSKTKITTTDIKKRAFIVLPHVGDTRILAELPTVNLYIVTGAAQGLGAALASRIAADPSNRLVALSRRDADLADPEQVARMCERVEAGLAGMQFEKAVLFNNAGVVAPVGPIDRLDPEGLARNLSVNLVAPMLLMRWFLRATSAVKLRRIVNISSGAGKRPVFGWSAYCAAKAGLDMATRVAALECQARGMAVEIVSLAPGVVDTGMQAAVRAAGAEDFAEVERFRRMKEEGALRPAADVAADILRLEAEGRLKGDAVQDLRQIP